MVGDTRPRTSFVVAFFFFFFFSFTLCIYTLKLYSRPVARITIWKKWENGNTNWRKTSDIKFASSGGDVTYYLLECYITKNESYF